MERDALAALEKRVEALRVIAAEKSVLARSLSDGEPPRFHAEISTALLALVVLVVFLVGREAGIFVVKGEPCAGVGADYAWVSFSNADDDVTLDTRGNLWRHEKWRGRVSPSAVREIADRLARGCFLEHLPSSTGGPAPDARWSTMSLHVGNRFTQFRYVHDGPMPLCVGHDDIAQVERAIRNVADGDSHKGID
jgi:hypothetical protein